MKSIKKITVFYSDGTFEDIEKHQTFDISKISSPTPTGPTTAPSPNWWQNQPTSYAYKDTYNIKPSLSISTQGIAALTTSQITSLTDYENWRG